MLIVKHDQRNKPDSDRKILVCQALGGRLVFPMIRSGQVSLPLCYFLSYSRLTQFQNNVFAWGQSHLKKKKDRLTERVSDFLMGSILLKHLMN